MCLDGSDDLRSIFFARSGISRKLRRIDNPSPGGLAFSLMLTRELDSFCVCVCVSGFPQHIYLYLYVNFYVSLCDCLSVSLSLCLSLSLSVSLSVSLSPSLQPMKLGFSTLRRRKAGDSTDYICPLEIGRAS